MTQSCPVRRGEGAARCVQRGRPDKGAVARRGQTGQPAQTGLPAAFAHRGRDRLARVFGLVEAGGDPGARLCSRTTGNRQRQPIRLGKRLRTRIRQTRPASDLHRTRCNCHREFSPVDLQMRCRQQDPTVCSVLSPTPAAISGNSAEDANWAAKATRVHCPRVRSGRSLGLTQSCPIRPRGPHAYRGHASPVVDQTWDQGGGATLRRGVLGGILGRRRGLRRARDHCARDSYPVVRVSLAQGFLVWRS